ncbi:family 43 glycosylhydrolase, partial [Streptomyces ipomoeae]
MSREHDLPEPPNRRLLLKGALAAGAFTAMPAGLAHAASSPAGPGAAAPYVNPLVRNRADPHIHRHRDGFYYFTATAPEYDRIILRRSRTLRGLSTASESVIWRKHATGVMGAHIW